MNPFNKAHKQTSIFITAGYPKLNSLEEQILLLQNQNIDFIEVGIPFSDPLADGPTIQESSSIAIANGMTIEILFQQLTSFKSRITVPLVLMGYLNPVMQYGIEKFLQKCDDLDIKGLILPDLSYELFQGKYKGYFEEKKVQLCFLITPQTENERITRIAKQCEKSFVYLVSQNSITGNAIDMNNQLKSRYSEIKAICGSTPLFLGFGIDSAEKRKNGFESCDGVIIGTAYLKAVHQEKENEFLSDVLIEVN